MHSSQSAFAGSYASASSSSAAPPPPPLGPGAAPFAVPAADCCCWCCCAAGAPAGAATGGGGAEDCSWLYLSCASFALALSTDSKPSCGVRLHLRKSSSSARHVSMIQKTQNTDCPCNIFLLSFDTEKIAQRVKERLRCAAPVSRSPPSAAERGSPLTPQRRAAAQPAPRLQPAPPATGAGQPRVQRLKP